jgi:hypothetical protein
VNGEETVVEDLDKGLFGARKEEVETGITRKLLARLVELSYEMNWQVVGELLVEIWP